LKYGSFCRLECILRSRTRPATLTLYGIVYALFGLGVRHTVLWGALYSVLWRLAALSAGTLVIQYTGNPPLTLILRQQSRSLAVNLDKPGSTMFVSQNRIFLFPFHSSPPTLPSNGLSSSRTGLHSFHFTTIECPSIEIQHPLIPY